MAPIAADLHEVRLQARKLAELADRLLPGAPTERSGTAWCALPADDAHTVAARLLQRARHRAVRVQSSYSEGPHEAGDPLLGKIHAELLAQGCEIRMLIPSRLARMEEDFARLAELASSGVRIRLSPGDLPTATVFDGQVGLLRSARDAPLTVIGYPVAARAMSVFHRALWAGTADLSPAHAGWGEDESVARVLRAVSEGYTDEKAARGVGLSVRTYRRHVAALLIRLDATSRFQAGVRAAQLGLIDVLA